MCCWGWRCTFVRIRGNNSEQANKIRVLHIPGELLDTKMIWFVHCPHRCAALQNTLDSTWTLQRPSQIEGWVQWDFNGRMWRTIQLGWYWNRFSGRATRAGHSLHLKQVTFTGTACTSSTSRIRCQRHIYFASCPRAHNYRQPRDKETSSFQ